MSVRSKGQQVKHHHHHHHHLSFWAFLSSLPVPLSSVFLSSHLFSWAFFFILISSSFFFFSRTFYPHLHPSDLHHHIFCISQNNIFFQEVRRVRFIPSRSALFCTFSHFLLSLFTSYSFVFNLLSSIASYHAPACRRPIEGQGGENISMTLLVKTDWRGESVATHGPPGHSE